MAAQKPTQPDYSVLIVVAGVALGVGLSWLHLPGAIVVVAALAVCGWLAPAPVLTGRKDSAGFPRPATSGEWAKMLRYRMWKALRWGSFIPSSFCLPGWPFRVVWVGSIGVSALVYAWPMAWGDEWRLVHAITTFVLFNQTYGVITHFFVKYDPSPSVTFGTVFQRITSGVGGLAVVVAPTIVSLSAFFGATLLINRLDLADALAPMQPWMFGAAAALAAGAHTTFVQMRSETLSKWKTMNRVRDEWAPRWEMLKQDPAPQLVDTETIGEARVDTFDADAAVGSAALLGLAEKLTPVVGTGNSVATLTSPNVDSEGQPQPGTINPVRFRIASWPSEQVPDLSAANITDEDALLRAECGMAWWADASGFARPVVTGMQRLSTPPGGEDPSPSAWLVEITPTLGITYLHFREEAGDIAGAMGAEVLVDHRNDLLFVGALTDGQATLTDTALQKTLDNLALEDLWTSRWGDILKMGAQAPRIEHATYQESELMGGQKLYRQAFVVRQGVDPLEYFKLEPKIATAMSAAPFVSVTGFVPKGRGDREGERHPQGFCVHWSSSPVPSNPDNLAPSRSKTAPQWVLAGRINQAFDASRLARPEVFKVRCLTSPKSDKHIWEMQLRLYGVTLADVRAKAEKMRQTLGCQWLRVAQSSDGCVIVAGASPDADGIVFATPEQANRDLVTRLDWEQAFFDAKLSSLAGVLPKLTSVETLPHNDSVQALDFELPSGLDMQRVKMAIPKLQTSTGNLFMEMRQGAGGADTFRLLAAPQPPIPNTALLPWESVDAYVDDDAMPFATGVDGTPIVWKPKDDPHLLIVGLTGSGKSIALRTLLYPIAISGALIHIVDPSKGAADFKFLEEHATSFVSELPPAAPTMKSIYEEVKRRKTLNSQYGVGSFTDLPADVRPQRIFVVIDEFTSLMLPEHVSKTPFDDPDAEEERLETVELNTARSIIGSTAGRIAREARSAGVSLILATQKLKVSDLEKIPGASDLKTNMSRLLLGNSTQGDRQSALRAWEEAPKLGDHIPKGRGLWESTSSSAPELIQMWFPGDDQEEIRGRINAYRQPLGEDDRLDIDALTPKKTQDEPPPLPDASDFGEQERVSLGEMELSLDDLEPEGAQTPDPANGQAASEGSDSDNSEQVATVAVVEAGQDPPEGTQQVISLPDEPGEDTTGWWPLDAALDALTALPSPATVVWVGAQWDTVLPLGVTVEELVAETLEDEGYTLVVQRPEVSAAAQQAPDQGETAALGDQVGQAHPAGDDEPMFPDPVPARLAPDDVTF